MHRCAVLTLAAVLSLAGAAQAADPIMPLSEVQPPGMVCTARSVIHGTAISLFDAEVLDVIADDPAAGGARLLVRVSGPAIDATGVGPGFSGSPILCDGRNAGAISESIGDYGNKVALATPIEAILGARPTAAARARSAGAAARRATADRALTVSAVLARTAGCCRARPPRSTARCWRPRLARSPATRCRTRCPAPQAASLSTGDISVGAVGTVAYRDGDQVFAFGHPLDALGRRSLFMQDACFGVINNPIGVPDLGRVDLQADPVRRPPLGAITNDTFSAIAGSVGGGPASIPLRVSGCAARPAGDARVAARGRAQARPGRGLGLIAPLRRRPRSTACSARSSRGADGVRASACSASCAGRLVCNSPTSTASRRSPTSARPRPWSTRSTWRRCTSRRGRCSRSRATSPTTWSWARVALARARRIDSCRCGWRCAAAAGSRSVTIQVPIPAGLRPGERTLVIEGNGFPDEEEADLLIELVGGLIDTGGPPTACTAAAEPRSPKSLASAVAALQRRSASRRTSATAPRGWCCARTTCASSGRAKVSLRVVRARR